jgi:hypothetical protein
VRLAVFLVLAVVASAGLAGTGGTGAAVADATVANVAVTGVNVTPATAVPGETVTVVPTIENFASSNETYDVTAVALRSAPGDDFREIARVRDPGRLSPGGSLQVPLTETFSTPGTKRLSVVVFGRTEGGDSVQLSYPVTVRVDDAHPKVELDVRRPVEGVESNATVTVANGLSRDLRNVEVTLSGDVEVERPRQVAATLPAGETRAFAFSVTPTDAGRTDVDATVEYTLPDGPTRETGTSVRVDARALEDRLDLTTNVTGNALSVTATNLGNTRIEDLVVGGESDNASIGQAVVPSLDPGASTTVRLPVRDPTGTVRVDVRASYEVGGRTVNTTGEAATLRVNPGRVTLTGIDVGRESGHLVVSGSASNVGLSPVDSVVVRAVETEGVTPVAPNREYFVGSIPASDFVSFDVTARVSANATEIPLEVSYLSDGRRRVERVSVPVGEAASTPSNGGGGSGGGGLLVPALVGLVVVVAVAALIVVAWRNRRGDD